MDYHRHPSMTIRESVPGVATLAEPQAEIDCYRLIGLLGAGGMGQVWRALDTVLEREVAIKLIRDPRPSPSARKRFLVEARALARIQHPNVVAVYRAGEVAGHPYLVYELVAGRSLDTMDGQQPWQDVLTMAIDMARGLAAAHQAGVLHRDLKPGNVMTMETGGTKLLDFGLAKILGGSLGMERVFRAPLVERELQASTMDAWEQASTSFTSGVTPAAGELDTLSLSGATPLASAEESARPVISAGTSPGLVIGTPRYIAPELWLGKPASPSTDLYALGLILWELLAGTPAHTGQNITVLARAIVDESLPAIATIRPDTPSELAAIVDRAVRKDPHERFHSADELRGMLEASACNLRALHILPDPARRGAALIESEASAVHGSLARLLTRPRFVETLYARLFARCPELRPLFPEDLTEQTSKLADALQLAVSCLRTPTQLHPLLEDLGARHVLYGVKEADFAVLRAVLFESIEEAEGEYLSDALKTAWQRAWNEFEGAICRGMKRAVRNGIKPLTAWREADLSSETLKTRQQITRYARIDDVSIAYQTFGSGATDIVVVPAWVSHCEVGWQFPAYARFFGQLGRCARVTLFDKRGTGMSDRMDTELPMEDRMQDLPAVLDAIGCDSAMLFGIQEGALLASLYAAVHPDRVRGLVLYGTSRRLISTADYPHGISPEFYNEICAAITTAWGSPLFAEFAAPSCASDPTFTSWWADYLRHGASPKAALSLLRMNAAMDIDAALPAISAPTIVIHRTGDRMMAAGGGRYVAERIPGARHVELPGDDHLPWIGDSEAILCAIQTFLAMSHQRSLPHSALVSALAIEVASSEFVLPVELELARLGARITLTQPGQTLLRVAELEGPVAGLRCAEALRRQKRIRRALVLSAVYAENETADQQPAGQALAALHRVPEGGLAATLPALSLAGGARIRVQDEAAGTIPGDPVLQIVESVEI